MQRHVTIFKASREISCQTNPKYYSLQSQNSTASFKDVAFQINETSSVKPLILLITQKNLKNITVQDSKLRLRKREGWEFQGRSKYQETLKSEIGLSLWIISLKECKFVSGKNEVWLKGIKKCLSFPRVPYN